MFSGMTSSKYITPRIGPRTLAAIALICLSTYGLEASELGRASGGRFSGEMLATGCVYGLMCTGCWLITALRPPVRFHTARVILIATCAGWLALGTTKSIATDGSVAMPEIGAVFECGRKYLIYFGGVAVGFGLSHAALGLPLWCVGETLPGRALRQCRIVDLIASTSVLAAVFAAGRGYETPVTAQPFWLVLIGVWVLLPLCCCLMLRATTDRGLAAIAAAGMACSLGLAVAVGLAKCTAMLDENWPGAAIPFLFNSYACLICGCLSVVALVGSAGRRDALARELQVVHVR